VIKNATKNFIAGIKSKQTGGANSEHKH